MALSGQQTTDKATEANKMSHKRRKALIRKEKRKAKRQAQAKMVTQDKEISQSESEDEAAVKAEQLEKQRQHELWLEREKKAQEEWLAMKEREKREAQKKLEMEQKIREEWEERQKKEEEEEEERDKKEQERKDKQDQLLREATANENKDAWHNPIAPARFGRDRDECPFFQKTGACRFAERCSRSHTMPESSCILMFPGMFTNFRLQQSLVEDNDVDDLELEYDDSELYQCFADFYNDVLPEFRSAGRVVQFKVSCNCERHLRGNVYVQYKNEESAQKAFVKFNGRWYAGRQLSCVFVNISKWKSAICGLAFVKRCPKGKTCNFLHVFRNPCNEFSLADKDIFPNDNNRDYRRESRHRYGSEGRDRKSVYHDEKRYSSRRYERSRSRSRSPSVRRKQRRRSRSKSHKRSRSRSRSHHRHSRYKSKSRSRSPRSSSRSNSKRRSRSRKFNGAYVEPPSVESFKHDSKSSDSSGDSDSVRLDQELNKSKSRKHKKNKKMKKHKHKHKKKKSEKDSKGTSPVNSSESEPDPEKPNIIEIPPDNSDEEMDDVIFEDVYV